MTTHAPLSSLCLSALLLAVPMIQAQQPTDTETAIAVAVKRKALVLEAQGLIGDARAAEARREILGASQFYNRALVKLEGIGIPAEATRTEALVGLERTELALARDSMKLERFDQARLHIDRVLKVDPGNKQAQDLRTENNALIEHLNPVLPHDSAAEMLDITKTNLVEASKYVQDGKLYFETDRLKEAEEALNRALRLDPDNKGAHYYLDLVFGRKFIEQARLREKNEKQLLMEVESEWIDPMTRRDLPVPNMYGGRTNTVFTSDRRQAIYSKLRTLRLNEWGPIDGLPLSEVIRDLGNEVRKHDIGGKGLNFIIAPNAEAAAAGAGVDAAGLPVADAGGGDLNAVSVRLAIKLADLSIEDILNILEKVADKRIKFSVEDYGILISPKAPEATPMFTRFYHIDPNTFQSGLRNVGSFSFGQTQSGGGGGGGGGGNRGGGGGGNRGGGGGNFGGNNGGNNQNGGGQNGGGATYVGVNLAGPVNNTAQGNRAGGAGGRGAQGANGQPAAAGANGTAANNGGIPFLTTDTSMATVLPTVTDYFTAAGVDLLAAGKAVFWNDRLGMLMVRATLADLDTVERAVQILNMSPPQVMIRAKIMEVNQDDSRQLGFDWYLGNTSIGGGDRIVGSGGTQPTLTGNGNVGAPGGPFPSPLTPILPASTDGLLTKGLNNSAPALATVTGILTDPQFRVVIHALEQRGAADLLSAPEITTESGRQAEIKVVDIRYIVTDLDTDQTAAGTGATAIGTTTGGGGGIGSLIQPIAEPFELGPVLDVVPYVNADGYTIQMTILPTLKEFLGYDDPGQFVAQIQGASSSGGAQAALTAPTPLPKFRLRQVATSCSVWDGQTVVLGGLISETVQKEKDKVPVLGDLPFFGRFFRSESNISSKKNLVIFVSPRIIDPSGNPVHTEDEMPFAAHNSGVSTRAVTQ